jgi:tocopherol O-methyltransferase
LKAIKFYLSVEEPALIFGGKTLKTDARLIASNTESLAEISITEKIQRFYDLGSPYYLSIYGEHIHDGYYIRGEESKKEAQENLVKLLADKAKIKKGDSVLDVGCGVGGSSIWLAKNLEAVTLGITISPVQIELARRFAAEQNLNSQFLLMDAGKMHFNQSFDVVWVVAALTHFTDPYHFLKLADSYLNKRGRFIIYDWMPDEGIIDSSNDPYIQPVSKGMLLSSLFSLTSYLKWFIQNGYRVTYAEDITKLTIKTWDDALSVIKDPAAWKLLPKSSLKELREFIGFFRSLRAMKLAMQKGKLRSGAIVVEKI